MALELSSLGSTLEKQQYAVKINQNWMPADYKERVDESILDIKFAPDIFQRQSFYFLAANKPVFVSAHTSSGKTLVAEYAIARSQANKTRVIYTSPIKALSNQKFYDLKQKFASVGLVTGDVQVNPDAQCLIMTTEILRNMIYKNSDVLQSTEYIIFDEVHYINDPHRGVIWEESIIMLPGHITLVMLSATIPNSLEFSEWVGRTRNQCVCVISTDKRAVPLEFVLYCDSDVFSLEERVSSNRPTNFSGPLPLFSSKIQPKRRFRINDLGRFITNRRLTPAIFFSFSKRACEEYGKALQSLDLTSPAEKSRIGLFIRDAMGALSPEDSFLPQVVMMQDQVSRGIAVHHGGLLPFVKECIELLFAMNLIKILVATETFAMGVNMPARCCVFLSITKIDSGEYRTLSNGEFIQMSGRAGRRGMDKVGTVIIADQRMPPVSTIRQMIWGIPSDLNSRFRLSFSLILLACRSNVEVEELMRNSLKEHSTQKNLAEDMGRLAHLEAIRPLDCQECSGAVDFVNDLRIVATENWMLLKRVLKPGHLVVTKENRLLRVDRIDQSGIKCTHPGDILLPGPLFSRAPEEPSQTPSLRSSRFFGDNRIQFDRSSYLAHSPMLLMPPDPNAPESMIIRYEDVFALVSDSLLPPGPPVTFDYSLTDILSISQIIRVREAFDRMGGAPCLGCPAFDRHYINAVEAVELDRTIQNTRQKYDRNSLALIDEYSARVKFLTDHGFLADLITLKGRVAAEIKTVNEVLATELIFANAFEEYSPSELIAVFSCMISEGGAPEEKPSEDSKLLDRLEALTEKYQSMAEELSALCIPRMPPLSFRMVDAVYDWCNGAGLVRIVSEYGLQEGVFVRLVLRLEECCKEMMSVAVLMGDTVLEEKFKEASRSIKRGIIFMPSLYI